MFIYEKPYVEIIKIEKEDRVCASVGEDKDEGGRIF